MKFKTLLKYFLIWQALIAFLVLGPARFLPLRSSLTLLGRGPVEYMKNPLLNFRANFDGNHYLSIASHGYNYGQQVFFPFYPILIRHLKSFISNPIFTGVVISTASFLLALVFLSRLTGLDASPSVAKWAILTLLFAPT